MMWRLKSRKLEKKLLAIDPEFLKNLNKRFNRFDRKNRKQWPWCDTIPLLHNNGFWRLAVLIRKEDVVFTSKFDKEIPSSCDSKMEFKSKRICAGRYLYRGFEIQCVYNYDPEGRNVWQCIDKDGSAFGHSYTLREAKREIDEAIQEENKK